MTTIAKSTNPNIETHPWSFSHDLDFNPSIYLSSPYDATDSSLEFIYGITTTLTSFIHHVTKLFKYTLYYTSLHLPLPSSLQDTCNVLGKRITTWSLSQERLLSIDDTCSLQTLTLIQSHILTFHSAIRIFFHTRLSPCATFVLAACSRYTLSKLQQMENIKMQHTSDTSGKVMAPVVWPGFVAACEAADEDRDAWQRWWVRMQSYRIGSIATMWTVVRRFGRKGGRVMRVWHCGSMCVSGKDRGSLVVVYW
jgi:arginine metabolism regulation protein II